MNNPSNINDILAQAAQQGAQERELEAQRQDDEVNERLKAASRGILAPTSKPTSNRPKDPNAARAAAILSVNRAIDYQKGLFAEAAAAIKTDKLTAAAILIQAFQELMSEKRGAKGIKQVQTRASKIATVWAMGQVTTPPADVNVKEDNSNDNT